jgi:6-pyruvoyltetrahydropterin/6-carboxytetrahydropterin synthase
MEQVIGNRIEKTFVPMRNMLFLTLAMNRAVVLGCDAVVTGICQEDNANYPDCTEAFRETFEIAANVGLGNYVRGSKEIVVLAPLMDLSKKDTVLLANSLDGCMNALAYSHTSYDGKYPPIDMNHANVLRAKGFEDAGLPDPLNYHKQKIIKDLQMPKHTVKRYHDISCGHRVVGHEGKCRHLHGHNYRIHFHCESDYLDNIKHGLDHVGRVIDFGEVKSRLCMWLENEWDHKFIAWEHDAIIGSLAEELFRYNSVGANDLNESFVFVPFNPTAENMAQYLVDVIGPQQMEGTGIKLVSVTIEETRKCSVTYGI